MCLNLVTYTFFWKGNSILHSIKVYLIHISLENFSFTIFLMKSWWFANLSSWRTKLIERFGMEVMWMENYTSALLDHSFFHSSWMDLNPHPPRMLVTSQMEASHWKLTQWRGSGRCVSVPEYRLSNEREKAEPHTTSVSP